MSSEIKDLSKLCIHTITTKPWSIEEAAEQYAMHDVSGITVWRDTLQGRNIKQTGNLLRAHNLNIVSLCRGGFFPSTDSAKRHAAIEDNRKAIAEAHDLGAPLIVLVCGADPSQPLTESRKQIKEGIERLIPEASAAGIKLAIEPLHPMYADTRSAINTLAQANDMVAAINSPWVGVAIDVYHLWWDENLEAEIKRCGALDALFAFHICDWKSPTLDMLNDRGLMGEGCIPIKKIRGWVEDTGFNGYNEVEIFSNIYCQQDQNQYLQNIISSYKKHS
jgi:sugar phosphate isomerase/epimerase